MKSRYLPQTIITATVVLCSLVMLTALAYAVTGFQINRPTRFIFVDFIDSTGIHAGSRVVYAGAEIGSVSAVNHLTLDERRALPDPRYAVRATVGIDEGAPEIPSDTKAKMTFESFLGEKFILLTAGSVNTNPLENGATIPALAGSLMENLENVGQKVDELLGAVQGDYNQIDLGARVAELFTKADTLLIQTTNLVANLDGTISNLNQLSDTLKNDYDAVYSPKLAGVLDEVKDLGLTAKTSFTNVAFEAQHTIKGAGDLIEGNHANLDKIIAELRVVSQNLKVVSTYAKALTSTVGEKPSRLVWGRKKTDLPTEEEIIASEEPIILEPAE